MRKMISVLLLLITIFISLAFSGFHSSFEEGMTEDRVIEPSTEDNMIYNGVSPGSAPAVSSESIQEGFQGDNMLHEEYYALDKESVDIVTKIPSREPTHSIGIFQHTFGMVPEKETFFIQHP